MAAHSFDIVSELDMQEMDNAVNQALRELRTRYDFKGSKSSIELNQKEKQIVVIADDEFKLKSVIDILETRAISRGISVKAFQYGPERPSSHGTIRKEVALQHGIDRDNAKKIVKIIKDLKIKVQASIMEDRVRVSGKKKDDLQTAINAVKQAELPIPLQFVNFRS